MKYADMLAERVLPPQRFNWLRSQRVRRFLVCTLFATLIWFILAVMLDQLGWVLVCLPSFFASIWVLRVSTRRIAEMPDTELDERMLAVRNQMFRLAYTTCTGLFFLLLVSSVIAMGQGNIFVTSSHILAFGFGFFFLLLVLPMAFYAWIEPEV